jgi:hypothetical protein
MKTYHWIIITIVAIALGFLSGYQYYKKFQTEKNSDRNNIITGEKSNRKEKKDLSLYSYQEILNALYKIEKKKINDYLDFEYNMKNNFLMRWLEITVKNRAHATTMKDPKFTLIFFSKTETAIDSTEIVLYEYLKPQQKRTFKKDISAPEDTESYKLKMRSVDEKDTTFLKGTENDSSI